MSLNLSEEESRLLDEEAHLTDKGNAIRLLKNHGQDMRYSYEKRSWVIWNGVHWAPDIKGEATRRMLGTIQWMFQRASALPEGRQRAKCLNFCVKSESLAAIRAALNIAQALWTISRDEMQADVQAARSRAWAAGMKV